MARNAYTPHAYRQSRGGFLSPPYKTGFTIVELLIAIVVIAILAAISITVYGDIQTRARDSRVRANLLQVRKEMEVYRIQYGKWPFEDELRAACPTVTIGQCSGGGVIQNWLREKVPTLEITTIGATGVFMRSDGGVSWAIGYAVRCNDGGSMNGCGRRGGEGIMHYIGDKSVMISSELLDIYTTP